MPQRSLNVLFLVLALWGAGLGAAAQYAKVSVVYDRLGAIYPVAEVWLGLIVSIVGVVGIALGVLAGDIVARAGFRTALIAALWAGAGLSALQALLPPLPVLLALRALEGVSHLAIVVAAPTLIAAVTPEAWRGLALTLWGTFFGVAYALLVWMGLPLVDIAGVSGLFAAHALWMAGFALLLARPLRGHATRVAPVPGQGGILARHVALYRSPHTAAPGLGWFFYTFCFLSTLTLIPPYLPSEGRAQVLGLLPLLSIVVSMTLGVWLMRWLRASGVVYLGFALAVLAYAGLWVFGAAPAWVMVLAGVLGLVQGATFAQVPEINATARDRARANGAMAQMGNLGNTLGTPVMAAVMAGSGLAGLAAGGVALFGLGLALHLWLARRRRLGF